MFTITSYMQYAKTQNKKLSELTGIIIYTGESTIPDQLFFIPKTITGNLETMIDTYFDHGIVNVAYILYFKPIERILPDLSKVMQKIDYIPGKYGWVENPVKISIGKFIFDHSFPIDSEVPEDTTVHDAIINIKGQLYPIKVRDLPNNYGVPKLFQAIP